MTTEGIQDLHTDTAADQGVTPDAPVVGESEHDKEMIAKADTGIDKNSENVQGNKGEQLFAGKYKTEAELHKGLANVMKMKYPDMSIEDIYKGLESGKLVPSSPAVDADGNADADKGTNQEGENTATDKVVGKLDPLDPVALTIEMEKNDGNLTPETREKLMKEHGISEQTINTHLAGVQALIEQFVGKVYDLTGGEKSYQTMIAWMNENIAEDELDTFNDQLATQDIAKVKAAVSGMNARFQAAEGSNPNLFRPSGSDGGTVRAGAYASKAEWISDMKNPLYDKDPAFRQQVINKLSISGNL